MTRWLPFVTIACLALGAPALASAQEDPLILRVSTHPGAINFFVFGTPGSTADVAEIVGPARRPRTSVTIGPTGLTMLFNAASWTCARTSRRFVATNAQGEQSYFSVRTPSCRSRVTVAAPRRARQGSRVTLRLTDTFSLASFRARLCISPPGGRRRCRSITLRPRGRPTRTRFRVTTRGRWRVTLSTRHQKTSRTVAVGVPARGRHLPHIFFTGDSMMQNIDNVIADRLAGRAEATSDVASGSALSKPLPFYFDFISNTRRRARRLRPAATVIFLGANDGHPFRTPAGKVAACCGEPWIAAYANRARQLIRVAGRRAVFINLPAPRDPERRRIFSAVNEALRRATGAERTSRLIDLVPVFTPGFVYRDILPQRGKDLYVRESDGIHISIDGAPIVASLVIQTLERAGVVPHLR